MKKLFVSVPMKGRSEEDIKVSIEKMKKIAEVFEGEELELIDSYVEEYAPPGAHPGIWYLGESLKKLSEADIFIGITDAVESSIWTGCYIEAVAAKKYGIKIYTIDADIVISDYDTLITEIFRHKVTSGSVQTVLF